jgi:hypothetical protein
MDDIKNIINEITSNTFEVLKKVYDNQKEGCEYTQGDNGSRLIFPHYSTIYRNGETRISEQELRFVFVEQFNVYCAKNNLRLYYSVETPTEYKYTFKDKDNPHKDEDGQSAMVDLCIHNEKFERVALVEFKALNPDEFCYKKDFCKLDAEKEGKPNLETFFIMIVKNADNDTFKNINVKIQNKDKETVFRCYNLEGGEEITLKIEKY